MRPKAVQWFDRLFIASILISAVDIFYNWNSYAADELNGEVRETFIIAMALAIVVSYAIQVSLWFFISYRASNKAKWILIIFSLLGLGGIFLTIPQYSNSELAFTGTTQLLVILSISFLFRQDARAWFRLNGRVVVDDDTGKLEDVFK